MNWNASGITYTFQCGIRRTRDLRNFDIVNGDCLYTTVRITTTISYCVGPCNNHRTRSTNSLCSSKCFYSAVI